MNRNEKLTKTEIGIKSECLRALSAIAGSVDISGMLKKEVKYSLVSAIKEATFHKIPKVRSNAKTLLNDLYNQNENVRDMVEEVLDKDVPVNDSKSILNGNMMMGSPKSITNANFGSR